MIGGYSEYSPLIGQERKAAKTLSAILLVFILTWTPYNVLAVMKETHTSATQYLGLMIQILLLLFTNRVVSGLLKKFAISLPSFLLLRNCVVKV